MMTLATQLEALANLVGGKAWGADKGKPRIYMPSARDRKVYFDFAEAGLTDLGGAILRVSIIDNGTQPAAWYAAQTELTFRRFFAEAMAITAYAHDAERAKAILCLEELLKPDQVDRASHAFANGNAEEAFSILGVASTPGPRNPPPGTSPAYKTE